MRIEISAGSMGSLSSAGSLGGIGGISGLSSSGSSGSFSSAGSLSGLSSVNSFQESLKTSINDSADIISAFKAVKNETYNLPGGVGSLQNTIESLDSRISFEQTKKTNAEDILKRSESFTENAVKLDLQVAGDVNRNRDEFYNVNPWLRPPEPATEEKKSFIGKAWDWLCGSGEALADSVSNGLGSLKDGVAGFVDGIKEGAANLWSDIKEGAAELWSGFKEGAAELWEGIKDTAKKAWNGLVDFYNEHKVAIAAVVVVAAVVLCFIPGTQVIGVAMLKGAAFGMLSGAVIGGVSGGLESVANGDSFWDGAAKGAVNGALDGIITGAAMGGLYGAGQTIAAAKGISASSTTAAKIYKVAKTSRNISKGMAAFDAVALIDRAVSPDNCLIYDLNRMAHSNPVYNAFQLGTGMVASFTGGMAKGFVKPYSDSRPAYAEGQREQTWENNKSADGKVYDPLGEEIDSNSKWDMGHKPGHEYDPLHQKYMDGRISYEDFLKEYRDPNNYRPETIHTNRSHVAEASYFFGIPIT